MSGLPIKEMMNIAPAMQAAALAKTNADFALKKRKGVKGFTKVAANNMAGAAFININSGLIGGLD